VVRITGRYDGKVLVLDGPISVPEDTQLEITVQPVPRSNGRDPILELRGLGAEIWQGIDPVEYQRREREGWD
jgi:hypothetical protein